MRKPAGFSPIAIFVLGFGLALVLVLGVTLLGPGLRLNSVVRSGGDDQVSNKKSDNKLPAAWTSCLSDNECAYLPHPCCPGWTAGPFSSWIVRNKPVDTSACQPAPAECVSAQPAIPNGKVIRSVCRKNRCEVEFIDNDLFKPVKMDIPCKESKQCPQPAGVCGKDGFCIEGNR